MYTEQRVADSKSYASVVFPKFVRDFTEDNLMPDYRKYIPEIRRLIIKRAKEKLEPHATLVAYPATTPKEKPTTRRPKGRIDVMSFGLENYWKGNVVKDCRAFTEDNKHYRTVKELMEAHNWDGKTVKFGHEENEVMFRHDVERHPEFENHLMIVVQCLEKIDPFHDPELRDHTGYHPETMLRFAEKLKHGEMNNLSEMLDTWYQDQIGVNDMVDNDSGRNLLVLTVCKKERHGSVAAKHLIIRTVRDILPDIEVNEPLTTYFGRHLCVRVGHCKFCAHEQMKDKITPDDQISARLPKPTGDCIRRRNG